MKEKFAEWAREHDIAVNDEWTLEQVADAIIENAIPWPAPLVNEEGWQLWTAVLRRDLAVASVSWDEIATTPEQATEERTALEVTFRLNDKREFRKRLPKEVLKKEHFGKVCKRLEDDLREWKVKDDIHREEQMAEEDKVFAQRAPDLMDDLIGFRAWNVSGTRLKPIGMGNDIWEGGSEVRAVCAQGRVHRPPAHDCECGLYAWYSVARLKREGSSSVNGQVIGAVQAYGKVQVHKDGFRSEYMRPLMLGYDDSQDRMVGNEVQRGVDFVRVREIAKHLGNVPVVPFSTIERQASEFGSLIPEDLRPTKK